MTDASESTHCHGCGRVRGDCDADPCGRSGDDHPLRFCPRCGWRLREIALVPGVGARWCRVHGALEED